MRPETTKRLRCAVYTRKSSEEGLEQQFNSLDAQREACEAYIASQVGEGWQLVKTRYDDGGLSGGTIERPALLHLLADIKAHRVDVVVVYKVDRLTRSLADFAKIVEVFDSHGVSFVSITQQFNTTTSMGRLTLNMLLSFAQFEREVTGERIRDKIAASKRKGMWMGGFVPLGYESKDRSLVINEAEAETVRTLFRLYLAQGSVRRVKEEADRLRLASKLRPAENGRMRGGRPLSRGYIYKLLGNPLYVGRIAHKGAVYDGQHALIIDAETWDAVQARLTENAKERIAGAGATAPSLLAGLLYDDRGNRLSPSHAVKAGRRYRYYVSQALLQDANGTAGSVVRLPAHEIEAVVCGRIRALLKDRAAVIDELARSDRSLRGQHRLITAGTRQAAAWPQLTQQEQRAFLAAVVTRITIRAEEIEIALSRSRLRQRLLGSPTSDVVAGIHPEGDSLTLSVAARLRPCSGELRLVLPAGNETDLAPRPNRVLIKALVKACAWKEQLISGRSSSILAIATDEGVTDRYVARLLKLAFLAPDIVEAILEGRQPADLELQRVLPDIPLAWDEQRRRFGFPAKG
jgi:DNA invertase Pin-like site-specific DNA recombinase